MLLAVGGIVAGAGQPKPETEEKPVPKEEVVIGAETFELELAANDKTRRRGLAGRKTIDDGGMLFVFRDARRRSFWMKDCLVDMDILFLDSRGRIVRTHQMKTEPPRQPLESVRGYERRLKLYGSSRPAQFAVELKAGSIDRLKLEPGQTIELDTVRLRKLAR